MRVHNVYMDSSFLFKKKKILVCCVYAQTIVTDHHLIKSRWRVQKKTPKKRNIHTNDSTRPYFLQTMDISSFTLTETFINVGSPYELDNRY